MVYSCYPTKLAIYINRNKKTIDQILAETGATAIINGGLFNSYFKPVCHLKADGVLYASDPYKYWGYGWNTNDIRMTQDYSNLRNYICCTSLIHNGQRDGLIYNADMGGKRPRTALGLFPDGKLWMYAESKKMTPEVLQDLAMDIGLDSAIMLDGGGSTQGISPQGAYRQGRICQNFILAWVGTTSDKQTECPYPEPTHNVGRWCFLYSPDEARWVQWQLNRHGFNLEVDGKFGKLSDDALRAFQKHKGLTADGICGKQTREALK